MLHLPLLVLLLLGLASRVRADEADESGPLANLLAFISSGFTFIFGANLTLDNIDTVVGIVLGVVSGVATITTTYSVVRLNLDRNRREKERHKAGMK